jgi:hypothetical protein
MGKVEYNNGCVKVTIVTISFANDVMGQFVDNAESMRGFSVLRDGVEVFRSSNFKNKK